MNVYKKLLVVIGAAIAAASVTTAAVAEDHGPTKGKFYLAPFAQAFSPPESIDLSKSLRIGYGAGIGYGFTDNLLIEANYHRSFHDAIAPGAEEDDTTVEQVWLDGIFKLSSLNVKSFTPYFVAGYGRANFKRGGALNNIQDNQTSAGLGLFSNLTPRVALRADVRGVYSVDADAIQPFAKLGFTAMLGNLGGAGQGPTDSDGDGVFDADDRCPNTPPGTAVDSDGCALDGDADGDGVKDDADRCPSTPSGIQVDSRGCALDDDRDGVPNYLDKCPGSEPGAKVDADGCYLELEEEVTIELDLEFDTNSSDLRTEHYPEIQQVVTFLREYPEANASIEGHTDSRGTAEYNQALSERRAASVRNYLINQGGVDADRLTSVGKGETDPIASNDTAEGRQENRRVSAVVAATKTVRQ